MVSKLLTFITGRLNPGLLLSNLRTASSKQARRPEFYKYIDYHKKNNLIFIKYLYSIIIRFN